MYRFPAAPPTTLLPQVLPDDQHARAVGQILHDAQFDHSVECFANDGKCSGKIVRAHSVQNAVILDQLCRDNHVYVVRLDKSGQLRFKSEGRNRTLTYLAFCGFHDQNLFNEIDFHPGDLFGPPTPRQAVLFHLRALGLERWTKLARVKQFAEYVQQPHRREIIYPPANIVEAQFNGFVVGHAAIEREFRSYMLQLQSNRFHPTITHYYSFPHVVRLASSAMYSVTSDIHGTPLVDPRRNRPYPHISLSVFPLNGQTNCLITHHRTLTAQLRPFVDQFDKGTLEQKQVWLTKVLLQSFENVVFSPDYIDGLKENRNLLEGWMTHIFSKDFPMPYIPTFNYFENIQANDLFAADATKAKI